MFNFSGSFNFKYDQVCFNDISNIYFVEFCQLLGQTETYVSGFGRLLIHDDGALDIYIYYIVNCRDSRGQNIC